MADTRVMIVDDSEDHRLLLKLRLQDSRCVVVAEASNGEEALELLTPDAVDVVLLDTRMPVMDGLEATKRIKGQFPDVRVIAISATGDLTDSKPIMEAGADGCYDKAKLDNLVSDLCR
jgi:CheY-like chemotaxis protein